MLGGQAECREEKLKPDFNSRGACDEHSGGFFTRFVGDGHVALPCGAKPLFLKRVRKLESMGERRCVRVEFSTEVVQKGSAAAVQMKKIAQEKVPPV